MRLKCVTPIFYPVGNDIMDTKEIITVQAVIKVPAAKVRELYTPPEDITHWNQASND